MPRPLDGLLVLDFTTLLPGPLATLMLAEAGAEVIKIERPGGEEIRSLAAMWPVWSAAFTMLNAGKKGVELDLKETRDRDRLWPLIKRADILVEQFRPGTMQRLGLGYDAVRAANPRLVYCSISGYGQNGPRSGEAGHDINYIGHTGLLSLQPGPVDRPMVPPALVADIGGGTFPAVINILLALRQRDATGEGCHLDVAMSDAMFTFAAFGLATGYASGRFPAAGELPLTGASPRYQLYPTSDGKLVACGALEQKFWLAFTAAIGLPAEFVDDTRDAAATVAATARIIAAQTAEHWRPIFARADCCATIVASLEEATRDLHFVGRGVFVSRVRTASGDIIPGLPLPIAPEFRDTSRLRSAPTLGVDTEAVLGAEAKAPRRA